MDSCWATPPGTSSVRKKSWLTAKRHKPMTLSAKVGPRRVLAVLVHLIAQVFSFACGNFRSFASSLASQGPPFCTIPSGIPLCPAQRHLVGIA